MTSPLLQAAARAWIFKPRPPVDIHATRDPSITLAALRYILDTKETRP